MNLPNVKFNPYDNNAVIINLSFLQAEELFYALEDADDPEKEPVYLQQVLADFLRGKNGLL